MVRPTDVLSFWLDEVGPAGWYKKNDALDADIRSRFLDIWTLVTSDPSRCDEWTATPDATLALLILLDQFPRNMFRGSAKSYASDHMARAIAKKAIDKGWDERIEEPQRQFFYTPLLHSECLYDQDRCIRLMMTRLKSGPENLLHARAHRDVIRRFGRFPERNSNLERANSAAETVFLSQEGGYGATVNALREASRAA